MTAYTHALAAALPILVVLALMVGRGWGGSKAGPVGWGVGLVVAVVAFEAGWRVLFYSQVKAVFLSAYVLYIVWSALALTHVVREAGALETISAAVVGLTPDRVMQLLILSWVFASFVQGVTGFGVPVAVVAPLLVGLGFPAITSVVAASIGHAWAVTFGSVGNSIFALLAVIPSRYDAASVAPASAAMLGIACVMSGLIPAYMCAGWSSLRHALPAVLIIGTGMALTQYAVASSPLWMLASFLAAMAGLVLSAAVTRLSRYQAGREAGAAGGAEGGGRLNREVALALSAYLVLLVVVVAARVPLPLTGGRPALGEMLDTVAVAVPVPETSTGLGYSNPAGFARPISIFGHTGALILYSAAIAFLIYQRCGRYAPGAIRRVVGKTLADGRRPTIGITFLVGMAVLMSDSGMTPTIAAGLSRGVGAAFPLLAPFIGAVGAIVTGSNTNSNVLFANLQLVTATALGLNGMLILGAQNVGGAVGSIAAPAKVIVGCSTVGLADQEGRVLRLNLVYALFIVAVTGVLTALLALVV